MIGQKWTAEADEVLRRLWAEGHSGTEIGLRMGITKNAVVGRVHRLRLPARPSPIKAGHRQYSAPRSPEGGGSGYRRAAAGAEFPPASAATSLGDGPRPGAAAATAHAAFLTCNLPGAAVSVLPRPVLSDGGKVKKEALPGAMAFPVRGCQFPMWPHGPRLAFDEIRFCDAPSRRNEAGRQDSAYCAEHHARCFTKAVKEAGIPTMGWQNIKRRGAWRVGGYA